MERPTPSKIEEMRASGCDPATIAKAEAWFADYFDRAVEMIEMIRRAFEGVKLEDGIGLRESDGMDGYAGSEELKSLREADEKDDWQRIPTDLLSRCYAAPSFLDAKGMHFHTPAFLVAELKGEFQQDFIGRLIDGSYSASDFPRLLTQSQRAVVIGCMRFHGAIYPDIYEQQAISNACAEFADTRSDEPDDTPELPFGSELDG